MVRPGRRSPRARGHCRVTELLRQCLVVLRKDLLAGWRSRARAVATGVFGVTTLLLFSFAVGPDTTILQAHAAGYLWLALLLSSTLALAESFRVEVEHGALETLLLLPTLPAAVFYGKAVANLLTLLVVGAALVPFMLGLYDAHVALGLPWLALVLLAGAAGISAPGTLHAALASRARSRDVLLPLLLFPLLVPCLLAAVKATSLVLTGDPMSQLPSWLGLLAAFDVIYWSLCGLLFSRVVEE